MKTEECLSCVEERVPACKAYCCKAWQDNKVIPMYLSA